MAFYPINGFHFWVLRSRIDFPFDEVGKSINKISISKSHSLVCCHTIFTRIGRWWMNEDILCRGKNNIFYLQTPLLMLFLGIQCLRFDNFSIYHAHHSTLKDQPANSEGGMLLFSKNFHPNSLKKSTKHISSCFFFLKYFWDTHILFVNKFRVARQMIICIDRKQKCQMMSHTAWDSGVWLPHA